MGRIVTEALETYRKTTPSGRSHDRREETQGAQAGRVYLRGTTWWLDFSRHGRRFRMPVETAQNENEAWDALEARRDEVRQDGARMSSAPV